MTPCHLHRLRRSQGGVKLIVNGEHKSLGGGGEFTAVTVKMSALCEVASCILVIR
jgi:hypothetical protein